MIVWAGMGLFWGVVMRGGKWWVGEVMVALYLILLALEGTVFRR